MQRVISLVAFLTLFCLNIFIGSQATEACGGYFPNNLMLDEDRILYAPQTTFALELDRFYSDPRNRTDFTYTPPPEFEDRRLNPKSRQTAITDVEELEIALGEMDLSSVDRERITGEYSELRGNLLTYSSEMHHVNPSNGLNPDFVTTWKDWLQSLRENEWVYQRSRYSDPIQFVPLENLQVPDGLPPEFDLYMQGAMHYYRGDWDYAVEKWHELLDLPAGQRHFRSTWAAYMNGKVTLGYDADEAVCWFRDVREMTAQGFADSLGLASATYRLEARVEYGYGNKLQALERYLDLYATGDKSELPVIRRLIRGAFQKGLDTLLMVAENIRLRKVFSIYICSHTSGYEWYDRGHISADELIAWLMAVELAGLTDLEDAGLLAWSAYRAGWMDTTQRWLDRANESGFTLWLQAKMQLREGRLEEAADLLKKAVVEYSDDEIWDNTWWNLRGDSYRDILDQNPGFVWYVTVPVRRILGELGITQLTLGRFEDALDSFHKGGWYLETSYLAELVLTPDELKSYVDANWPNPGSDVLLPDWYINIEAFMTEGELQQACVIRYLLAKRLARIGRWREAMEYYPANLRPAFEAYIQGIRRGHSTRLSLEDRADAFWEAAQIARHQGIDLLGTHLYPDWAIIGGNNSHRPYPARRTDPNEMEHFPSTDEERVRITESRNEIEPYRWLHYRYIAAGHAWSAVELMPDESDVTAYRLCVAGGWIKSRDPEGADVFYKAMVNRCRSTDLGQLADAQRWFPDCEEDSVIW